MTGEGGEATNGLRNIVIDTVDIHSSHVEKTPTVDAIHPFDTPDFAKFLETDFPDVKDAITNAARPTTSENPDELESWEAEQIRNRKKRMPYESEYAYLSRLLYEETFSVNQSPGNPNAPGFKGVLGLTPGGLVSHFYLNGSTNGYTVDSAIAMNPQGKTLREGLMSIQDRRNREGFIDVVDSSTHPMTFGGGGYGRMHHLRRIQFVNNSEGVKYSDDMDSVGYRLIQMLAVTPEMSMAVQDPRLKAVIGFKPDREVQVKDVIRFSWGMFGKKLLTDYGTYKQEDEEGVKAGIADLLFMRTHPEMQIFYKYLSPSGYINTARKEE